ncbi:MAG: O-antigen ligase family protein [Candidatus Moraniibacteriota bacterium]|nr:MAG: O-antigen ligase family protein [Candidatus Moranbacteria bacterium]
MSDNVVSAPRIYGTFVHPNVLALYLYSLAVVLVMNFFPTSEEEKKRTFHTFPVITLLSFSLIIIPIISLTILTYTRVAWIALFLFALFVALWKFRFLLFPLLVTPLILILFVPSIQARFSETFERSVDSSIVWRQGIWHDVTTKLRMDQKEYFGTGPATFTLYAEKLRGTRFGSTDAHNDFVKFYVEGGWFGFSAFLLFLFLLTIDIRSLFLLPAPLRDFAVLFSLYAGILLLSSLSDNVHRYTPLQWIFFVLLGALLALRTHETTQVRIQENGKKE